MTTKRLYRITREDGGITHTTEKPDEAGYNILYRLIADEGKMLTTDNENLYSVIDVESADGWHEVEKPIESWEIVGQ